MADVEDGIPAHWSFGSLAALFVIVLLPPGLIIGVGRASAYAVAAGALLWSLSIVIKRPLLAALQSAIQRLAQAFRFPSLTAGIHGFLSAAAELIVAALYLWGWQSASLADVTGFGIGAGSIEAAYILSLTLVGQGPSPAQLEAWIAGARLSLCVRYMVPIERLSALLGHVGSRGLVYCGLNASWPLAGLWLALAFSIFTLIDGFAVLGHIRGWNWCEPRLCRRSQSFFAVTSGAEVLLFLLAFGLLG